MAERVGTETHDVLAQRSTMESGATENVRRLGGLLVQTGLQPETFATLREKLGFHEGYRQMIQNARQKYVLGKEPLPPKDSLEYKALAEFMFHPDVFRQIVILQNRNLTGTTFVRPAEDIMGEVYDALGADENGALKVKDLSVLLAKLTENTFDATKDARRAREIGLTGDDIRRIETNPDVRKEYSAEISYGVKSKPPDLLADEATLEVFSHLSSPLSFASGYVPQSLRAIATDLRARIEKGEISLGERERAFVLDGLLPLIETVENAANEQARVRLRNVLWSMQSYGLCSIPITKDGSGAIGLLPVHVNEAAGSLLADYVSDFMAGDAGADTATGADTVKTETLQAVIDGRRAKGELSDTDARAIQQFLKRAGNPIYRSITRLVSGRRPTIGALKRRREELRRKETVAASASTEWDTLKLDDLIARPDDLEGRLALLKTQGERDHIRSRIDSYAALKKLPAQSGEKESRVDALSRKADDVLAVPFTSLNRETIPAHLTALRRVHTELVTMNKRFTTERDSIRAEIRKQRGIRWEKGARRWGEPKKPETPFTKFLEVCDRAIGSLSESQGVRDLRAHLEPLERDINYYQEVVPAALRSTARAREAIRVHGEAREAAAAEVSRAIDILATSLAAKDATEAKRLTLVLDSTTQLLVPAEKPRERKNVEVSRNRSEIVDALKNRESARADSERKLDLPVAGLSDTQAPLRIRFYVTARRTLYERLAKARIRFSKGLPDDEKEALMNDVESFIQEEIAEPIRAAADTMFLDPKAVGIKASEDASAALKAQVDASIEELVTALTPKRK